MDALVSKSSFLNTRFTVMKGGSKPHCSSWNNGDLKQEIELATSLIMAVSDSKRMFGVPKKTPVCQGPFEGLLLIVPE